MELGPVARVRNTERAGPWGDVRTTEQGLGVGSGPQSRVLRGIRTAEQDQFHYFHMDT